MVSFKELINLRIVKQEVHKLSVETLQRAEDLHNEYDDATDDIILDNLEKIRDLTKL